MNKKLNIFINQIKLYLVDRVRNISNPLAFRDTQTAYRRSLNNIFKIRDRIFFRKKKPESETYPFSVVDPFELFGEDHPYGDFSLIGEDWRNKDSSKPVAILWGFNNWKWGFVSAYLPEYRSAFAPRKISSLPSLLAIKRFPIDPTAFIFWGYTESWVVRWYAKRNNIKIFRMEDGFIRSSSLGASHSTPYSLLLDATGLHYNPEVPSDIENILNTHVFSEEELEVADACMTLMKDLRLSKYNPATLISDHKGPIKIKRRVAVLGQVDNDMSIRLGNPDRWSMIELIRLAKIENPDSEILYRPHPDIYKGYQRSFFKQRAVEKFCQIASPEVPLVDFLESVDHVYTITSLAGLEALLMGKKVSVVGAAFYAGWGMTDDRVVFPRRTAKRTLLELFAGVYLKYPRYLANLDDKEIGFQAACFRIKADLEIDTFDLFNAQKVETEQAARLVAISDYWPQLLFKKNPDEDDSFVQKQLDQIDFEKLLAVMPGRMFQITLTYALCGVCKTNASRDSLINKVRNYLDLDILNSLLLDLSKSYPGEYVAKQFAWLLSEVDENNISLDLLSKELGRSQEAARRVAQEEADRTKDSPGIASPLPLFNDVTPLSKIQAELLLEIFDFNVSMRKLDEAIEVGKRLLLAGFFVHGVIKKLTKIAVIRFDMHSARCLSKISQRIDLYDQNRMSVWVEASNYTDSCVKINRYAFIDSVVKLVVLKPDKINDAEFLIEKFSAVVNDKNMVSVLYGILMLDNDQSIRKSAGFISVGKTDLAIGIIELLIRKGDSSDNVRIAYSQALSYAGRLGEAIEVMNESRKLQKTSANYRESLRLCVLAGDYNKGYELLKEAQVRKIELGDMHPRKIYFGCRMPREAFETFTQLSLKKAVETYYKNKYFYTDIVTNFDKKLLFLAIFGPGDEIRFSSIYNLLPEILAQKNISVSCSPRLVSLFERSFPRINFVPVERPRNSDLIDLSNYSNVLGSDISGVIDNAATAAIDEADYVMLVTDMLHECLPTYESFPGTPYLKHNNCLTDRYQELLPKNIKLVGLSWRSSVTTHSRNEHYLTVQELEPVFVIPGVQFVNFQYDECQGELDWIESRYPGKMINISEIDQYNDFEGVAALMKCMDLMIAPATTVVELAGALGCPTWLLSNSSELFWRKIDQRGTDVWHNSITHVEGEVFGDKNSLVDKLRVSLLQWLEN